MQYRDSSIATHYTRGIIAGAESSHGVKIEGGSTGGVVEPVGDDANIALTLRSKGDGALTLRPGTNPSTQALADFKGFHASTFTVQIAAISSGQIIQAPLSTAFGNFALGDLISIDAIVTPAEAVMTGFRSAADATTRVTMLIANPGSTATSTGRVVGTISWIDLT